MKNYLLSILAVFLAFLSISCQGLWIDEGITARFACLDTISELIEELTTTHLAESLFPGYVIYLWTWTKLFGWTEFALRLSNLPLMAAFFFFIVRLPLSKTFRTTALLVTALSPFVWFYMNEARPYTALISFSGLSLCGLIDYFHGHDRQKRLGPYITVISLAVGFFFNLSMAFWGFALVGAAFCFWQGSGVRLGVWLRDWIRPVLWILPVFLFLLGYYYVIISKGSGGRLQELHSPPGLMNLAFVFYEFLGFMGLGPPRNMLRADPSISLLTEYLPLLAPAVAALACLGFYFLWKNYLRSDNLMRFITRDPYLFGFFCSLMVFLVFARGTAFIYYGRHVAFLFPALAFSLAHQIHLVQMKSERIKVGAVLLGLLIATWLISDFRLRFDQQYMKDDYRTAAAEAVEYASRDIPVVWAADEDTGSYYGLSFFGQQGRIPQSWKAKAGVYMGANWEWKEIKNRLEPGKPLLLVLSKSDLFDQSGGWELFLKQNKPEREIRPNAFRMLYFPSLSF